MDLGGDCSTFLCILLRDADIRARHKFSKSKLPALSALKFQAPTIRGSYCRGICAWPTFSALLRTWSVKQGYRLLDPGTRLGETVVRKGRMTSARVSVRYGLDIPKAPVLVGFSAGIPQQRCMRRRKGPVRGRHRWHWSVIHWRRNSGGHTQFTKLSIELPI
jgi:hypothetical protein